MKTNYIPYKQTNTFSKLVTDYLSKGVTVQQFYEFGFDEKGVEQAIQSRPQFPVNRKLLVNVLKKQYANENISEALKQNIEELQNENCFTICTAHQPNLLTGYLYFIYKIVHSIKLAQELNKLHPDKKFVPVYYMGSEDNDLEELGVFHYEGKNFRWDGGAQSGAFGSMHTKTLKTVFEDLFKTIGPPNSFCDELKELLTKAYLQHSTIADATLYLINELFGQYGLLVLNPNNAALKSLFINIMKDDLLNHSAFNINNQTATLYKEQVYTRSINLFYLKENLRERIEKKDELWWVKGTDIHWNERDLLLELETHPERFSPNVILRGVFQETILPNIVFIGGGSEVAYWLQLKQLFKHNKVFFPSVHLRQSVLFLNKKTIALLDKLSLQPEAIFMNEEMLVKEIVERNGANYKLADELNSIDQLMLNIHKKATDIDKTLSSSAHASLGKMKKQLTVLEHKMYRAEKRKIADSIQKIHTLKNILFPLGVLQERHDNFIPYYLKYGNRFFEILLDTFEPFRHELLIVEEES